MKAPEGSVQPTTHTQEPPPAKFEELGLDERLMRAVLEQQYRHPTPVQVAAIPAVLSGRDVIGCAQTGTGKTAAFLLPLLHKLAVGRSRGTLRPGRTSVLILTPTRELASQIDAQRAAYGRYVPHTSAVIFGGVSMVPQEKVLQIGPDIVIACPGRLLDHLDRANLDLTGLSCFVLDEADRMLDMGFLPDVRRVLSRLPTRRQGLLFSATLPPAVRKLAAEILREPVRVDAGPDSTPPPTIRHAVYPVPGHLKFKLLCQLLHREEMTSTLVFVRTRRRADRVAKMLFKRGLPVACLHGDLAQNQRAASLHRFRTGQCPVLVATDIAARGLDIEGVSHVINYDLPVVAEDYVHRIGRTGRAQAYGEAFSLMSPEESELVVAIEVLLGQPLERLSLSGFDYDAPPPPEGVLSSRGLARSRHPGCPPSVRQASSRGFSPVARKCKDHTHRESVGSESGSGEGVMDPAGPRRASQEKAAKPSPAKPSPAKPGQNQRTAGAAQPKAPGPLPGRPGMKPSHAGQHRQNQLMGLPRSATRRGPARRPKSPS